MSSFSNSSPEPMEVSEEDPKAAQTVQDVSRDIDADDPILICEQPPKCQLEVGSAVVHKGLTGVVRWIGSDLSSPPPATYIVAVELNAGQDIPEECSNGYYKGEQPVHSDAENILYCNFQECCLDERFLIDGDTDAHTGTTHLTDGAHLNLMTSQTISELDIHKSTLETVELTEHALDAKKWHTNSHSEHRDEFCFGDEDTVELTYEEPQDAKFNVGSTVVYNGLRGVVKLICRCSLVSKQQGTLLAALELEDGQDLPNECTFGDYRGLKVVTSDKKNVLFCALNDCTVDDRFVSSYDSAVEEKNIPSILRTVVEPQPVNPEHLGLWKGIQGDHNSCYMDVTLFSMFAYTSLFDKWLRQDTSTLDKLHAGTLKILNENIVNPLRRHGIVAAQSVKKLREQLDQFGLVRHFRDRPKDPEEFLNFLLSNVFQCPPLIDLNNGLRCNSIDLVAGKNATLCFPTVQMLLEKTLREEKILFAKRPECLILQIPRFGKEFKMYDRIFPNWELDITDFVENVKCSCSICRETVTADYRECRESNNFKESKNSKSCAEMAEKCRVIAGHSFSGSSRELSGKCKLQLSAVLCIETSHYVSFNSTGSGRVPWVFFNSMSERPDSVDLNIPEVREAERLNEWLRCYERARDEANLAPPLVQRLFNDAYICFYSNSNEESHDDLKPVEDGC